MTSILYNQATNIVLPNRNINVQLQSNQFVLPTQLQNQYDTFNIYPSVQAASTESFQNLKAEMGQSTANGPYRMNDDSLYNTLREDRKLLSTMRANSTQNPFPVRNRNSGVPEYLFTGGYQSDLMFVDDENRQFLGEEKRLDKSRLTKMAKQPKMTKKMMNFQKNRDYPDLNQILPNIKVGLNIQSPMLGIRGENNTNNSNLKNRTYYLENKDVRLQPIKMNTEFKRGQI